VAGVPEFSISGTSPGIVLDQFMQSTVTEETTETAVESKEDAATKSAGDGGEPPKNDDEEESKADKVEMAVNSDSIHEISDAARKKQGEFVKLYEDIRKKIESNYGKGNGDYEVEKDLYEMVPDRLPVDEDSVGILAKLVDYLVFLIDLLYKDKPYQRFYVLETVARVPYFLHQLPALLGDHRLERQHRLAAYPLGRRLERASSSPHHGRARRQQEMGRPFLGTTHGRALLLGCRRPLLPQARVCL
jgi:hypothetical protein